MTAWSLEPNLQMLFPNAVLNELTNYWDVCFALWNPWVAFTIGFGSLSIFTVKRCPVSFVHLAELRLTVWPLHPASPISSHIINKL